MFVHKVARLMRKVAPLRLLAPFRGIGTGLLTPIVFSYQTGHIRSSLKSKSVDKNGRPLPWYTYPAIDFLATKNFKSRSVLEFGAGQSSLWWGERAERVVAFEDNSSWYGWLKTRVSQNVSLELTDKAGSEIEERLGSQKFDVIVIDGLDRLAAAKTALGVVADGGAIILDNSEGFWGQNGDYPIMNLYRENGFSRIDFYGHAPGVILPACTSLFFRNNCFLLSGVENPARFVT